MTARRNLGILVLAAVAASCAPSNNLDGRLNGNPSGTMERLVTTQSPAAAQESVSKQDKLNQARLDDLKRLYPSPNINPVYIGDYRVFIENKAADTKSKISKMIAEPNYWAGVLDRMGTGSIPDFYPFRSMEITSRQKLEEVLSNPKSRKELEQSIIGHYGGMIRLDEISFLDAHGPSPSFLPVLAYIDPSSFGKSDASFDFNFAREAFEKRIYLIGREIKTIKTMSKETNSLASYMLAKFYAEQLAHGTIAGEKISAKDWLSLDDGPRIKIGRASALMETYWHFGGIDLKSPEARLVGAVLTNLMGSIEPELQYSKTNPLAMRLIEKLKADYRALLPNVAAPLK